MGSCSVTESSCARHGLAVETPVVDCSRIRVDDELPSRSVGSCRRCQLDVIERFARHPHRADRRAFVVARVAQPYGADEDSEEPLACGKSGEPAPGSRSGRWTLSALSAGTAGCRVVCGALRAGRRTEPYRVIRRRKRLSHARGQGSWTRVIVPAPNVERCSEVRSARPCGTTSWPHSALNGRVGRQRTGSGRFQYPAGSRVSVADQAAGTSCPGAGLAAGGSDTRSDRPSHYGAIFRAITSHQTLRCQ